MPSASLLSSARGALAWAWLNGWVALLRNPLWVISYLTMPLSLLFLLNVFGAKEMMLYAIVGGVTAILSTNGIGIMGDASFYRIYLKFQDMVAAGPTRPEVYMLGLALSSLLYAAPGLLLFFAIMVLQNAFPSDAPLLLLSCVLLWSSNSSLGFILSMLFREMREVWPTMNILTFAIAIVPPVYYPFTILPGPIGTLALLVPTASGAALMQSSFGLVSLGFELKISLITLLTAYTVVLFLLAMYRSRWREP